MLCVGKWLTRPGARTQGEEVAISVSVSTGKPFRNTAISYAKILRQKDAPAISLRPMWKDPQSSVITSLWGNVHQMM